MFRHDNLILSLSLFHTHTRTHTHTHTQTHTRTHTQGPAARRPGEHAQGACVCVCAFARAGARADAGSAKSIPLLSSPLSILLLSLGSIAFKNTRRACLCVCARACVVRLRARTLAVPSRFLSSPLDPSLSKTRVNLITAGVAHLPRTSAI